MKHDFTGITNQEFTRIVDLWVKDARARDMLKSRFLDGLTFDELASKYHMSSRQIKRIIYRHGDRLLTKI